MHCTVSLFDEYPLPGDFELKAFMVQNIGSHISHQSEQFHSKFCTDKLDSTLKEVSKFEVCILSESENIAISKIVHFIWFQHHNNNKKTIFYTGITP